MEIDIEESKRKVEELRESTAKVAYDLHHNTKSDYIMFLIAIILPLVIMMGQTGFRQRNDVFLRDYVVSSDGTSVTLTIDLISSKGYVRKFKDNGGGENPHYLTFYQTFGGFNSSWGAIDTFVLNLEPTDTEIYFLGLNNEYYLVLAKDEKTGEWVQPKYVIVK